MDEFLKFLVRTPLRLGEDPLLFVEGYNPNLESFDFYCIRMHAAAATRMEPR